MTNQLTLRQQWTEYENDFNAMTDEEIDREERSSRDLVDEHENWLEAVAAWKADGKPRNTKGETNA